jgi:hypothetical protein
MLLYNEKKKLLSPLKAQSRITKNTHTLCNAATVVLKVGADDPLPGLVGGVVSLAKYLPSLQMTGMG